MKNFVQLNSTACDNWLSFSFAPSSFNNRRQIYSTLEIHRWVAVLRFFTAEALLLARLLAVMIGPRAPRHGKTFQVLNTGDYCVCVC